MTQELFNRVTEWQRKTFPKATPLSKLFHLEEELEELKQELNIQYTDSFVEQRLRDEYADCFLLLYGSAAANGYSLEDINKIISSKMDKNEKRTWGTPDEKGVVRHVKENGHD